MKKTLSLILAIILTFSMGTLAFAGEAVALTKDEAKAKAVEHVNYDSEVSLATYALSGTYDDDIQGTVEVYNVTSTLVLKTGRTVTYYTVVDKYNGKIYYQKATVVDLPSIFDLTEDTALSLAIEVLGLNESNTSVLSTNGTEGKAPFSFVLVEGFSQKYECTVKKGDLLYVVVDYIKVSKYNNDSSENSGISGLIEKIVLIFKVLVAKLNPANLLDKISATDLLKVFQFLAG